jgi:hypothetical protein
MNEVKVGQVWRVRLMGRLEHERYILAPAGGIVTLGRDAHDRWPATYMRSEVEFLQQLEPCGRCGAMLGAHGCPNCAG